MDSSTFSYPSTDLWKPVTSRSCTRRRCNPHSGFGFRVLQLGTRNQKLGTFTSYNHIPQSRRLFTEDFHHRKQGLSPQNPLLLRSSCPTICRAAGMLTTPPPLADASSILACITAVSKSPAAAPAATTVRNPAHTSRCFFILNPQICVPAIARPALPQQSSGSTVKRTHLAARRAVFSITQIEVAGSCDSAQLMKGEYTFASASFVPPASSALTRYS